MTLVLLFGLSSCAFAQTPDITGVWSINAALSDNTDKRVEAALRAAGEKIQSSWFDRRKDRYRGGPAEQELYDRMSYDSTLRISLDADADAYDFTYADAFSRLVYTDNRSHSVSLNALDTAADFSLGHWEGEVFKVEAHPRDGGYAEESYRLSNGGKQLHVELYILPRAFREAITLKRVYDKQ
ncbi:MAG: hypothetical protein LBF16_07240 [Pseudomonadales bacterium]|nr:hypothetical protein [Pseudomonadales bacterium]